MLTLTLLLSACSKDRSDDARALLATIPSSAGVVALADCHNMLDKAGGAQTLSALITKESKNPRTAQMAQAISESWNPDYAAIFNDGSYLYITTMIDNPGKLREALDKDPKTKLQDQNGVSCNASLAMIDGQVWVLLSNGSINPENIKGYKALSENRSFLSNDYADKLVEDEHDIRFLAVAESLFSLDGTSPQQSMVQRMIVSALFKDGAYLAGDVNFEAGRVMASARVLDNKYRTAEFLLPLSKIDQNTIKQTTPHVGTLFAIGASEALVKKIKDIGSSLGGMLPADLITVLSPLNGTISLAISSVPGSMRGIVTINDNNPTMLREALAQSKIQVTREGNHLLLAEGPEPQGTLATAERASLFKDAVAGVVSADKNVMGASAEENIPFSLVSVMLTTPDKGLQLKAALYTTDAKTNALKTILQTAK